MGVLSELVAAPRDEASEVASESEPISRWNGFSFKGLDNVKIGTLLSLIRSGDAYLGFEATLDSIAVVSEPTDECSLVFVVENGDLETLASVAQFGDEEFGALSKQWSETEEFEGWSTGDVDELLRSITDLAESAVLEKNCLFLWIAL
ncbi:MAG: hypothetical protein JNG89_11510 [Planctomycetaceae bacterium]|nr:hypothetical protein [Planctomycetaceae bacterium]